MKRITFSVILATLILSLGAAQSGLSPLLPKNARTMGLGGGFVATSSGFDSLYGNPAAFASSKGQLTLMDLSTWLYAKPTGDNIATALGVVGGTLSDSEMASAVNALVVDNGFGGGFSTGIGYVGHGFAVGTYAVGDAVASGSTALGATITSSAAVNAVVGLAFALPLGEKSSLSLGGDVRPFFRADSPDGGWFLSSLVTTMASGGDVTSVIMGEDVVAGFGLAMDLGAQLTLGTLSLGLAVRDITPSYVVQTETVQDLLGTFSGGSLGATGSDKASLVPGVYAGLAWAPTFLKGFLDPTVYLEVQDLVPAIQGEASLWNYLHAGLDLKVFSFIDLQAGLNGGWLSFGAGLNLYLVEINAAVFTEELGTHPGDEGRTGISLQASIHL